MKWNYFNEEKDPFIVGIDNELMALLDRARHQAGIPFILTSGKRTEEKNKEAGGVPDSAHLTGHAVDLQCKTSEECFKIVSSLLNAGAERIVIGARLKMDGLKDVGLTFHNVHVDNDKSKPPSILSVKLYK